MVKGPRLRAIRVSDAKEISGIDPATGAVSMISTIGKMLPLNDDMPAIVDFCPMADRLHFLT